MEVLVLSLSVIILLLSLTTSDALCHLTGQPGTLLAGFNDSNGNMSCRPGFYCPGFDPANATTFPESCLAHPACAVERMWGRKCDEEQGTFEPYVCPGGYYCPYNKGTMHKCPDGALCKVGSTEYEDCPPLSYCIGSHAKNYGVMVYWVIITTVFIFLYVLYGQFCLVSTLYAEETEEGAPASAWDCDQRLVDGFKRSRGYRPPLRLEFMNLAVSVEDKATGQSKSILKDMSGTMEPGTVTAIMGPSGAGKTTFMMALLGKKDPAWNVEGNLLVNGMDKIKQLRHSIGFVPQDDVLHTELSVYKNLYYSSETRLPRDWTPEQRAAFRSAIVESLGLTTHRDTKIGDEHERGVSGGQRKRASIGVELAAAPLAMFLDEPTSGLDSTTSLGVCTTLKKIAMETDLTVGMVIHQPRVEIWNGLDQVLFIGKGGRVVYQGPQEDAQAFFEKKCNIKFMPESNPADVIIDVIAQNSDTMADLWKKHIESTGSTLGNRDNLLVDFEKIPEPYGSTDSGFRGASVWRQFLLSHNRYIEKQLANMAALRVELIVCTLCGLVLGYSLRDYNFTGFFVQPYRKVSPYPMTATFPQMNMYAAMSIALGSAPSGVRVFGNDRFNYFREVASGYSPIAYFIGTLLSVIYRCAWVTHMFCAVYYFLGGMPIDFGTFYMVMFLIYWNAYAMGMICAHLVSKRMAPLVAQVLTICIAIFNGFVAFPEPLKQMAYPFHASQIIMNLWYEMFSHIFEPQFEEWDYQGDTITSSFLVMVASSVIFQVIAFLLMIGTHRERQQ